MATEFKFSHLFTLNALKLPFLVEKWVFWPKIDVDFDALSQIGTLVASVQLFLSESSPLDSFMAPQKGKIAALRWCFKGFFFTYFAKRRQFTHFVYKTAIWMGRGLGLANIFT